MGSWERSISAWSANVRFDVADRVHETLTSPCREVEGHLNNYPRAIYVLDQDCSCGVQLQYTFESGREFKRREQSYLSA
jgi:hypothetical protein